MPAIGEPGNLYRIQDGLEEVGTVGMQDIHGMVRVPDIQDGGCQGLAVEGSDGLIGMKGGRGHLQGLDIGL